MSAPGLRPLADALDAAVYGGKAALLARARRAGLPVPDGVALAAALVDRVAAGEPDAVARVGDVLDQLGAAVAVRSSAIGEDSPGASYAGQHLTVLNVRTRGSLVEAVRDVARSGRSAAALAYRRGRGETDAPRVAVVIQPLVAADVAGVLFTRDPVSGADELIIEAAWGLGESVVAGRVIPDRYRLDARGVPGERRPGYKHVAVRPCDDGGTAEFPVASHLVSALCLGDADLGVLYALGRRCDDVLGEGQDVEWALARGQAVLLQSRPITMLATSRRAGVAGPDRAPASTRRAP